MDGSLGPDSKRQTSGRALSPAARRPCNSAYSGFAEPFAGNVITGWAVKRQAPNEPVRLHVLIDNNATDIIICDRAHPAWDELGLPNDVGGFAFDIPPKFLDGNAHSVSILFDDGTPLTLRESDGQARLSLSFTKPAFIDQKSVNDSSGQSAWTHDQPIREAEDQIGNAAPLTSIQGFLDGVQGEALRGWALRRHHGTGKVEVGVRVQFLCNGVVVGETIANHPRMDVASELQCDPEVGFQFRLPPRCRSGQEFEFVAKVLPEGEVLAGCPLVTKPRGSEPNNDLQTVAGILTDLCATTFKLQQQLRSAMSAANATVLDYDGWARRSAARLRDQIARADPLPDEAPLVSIVMPTYRANLAHLTAAIDSVRLQTYPHWELIIVDDGSRDCVLTACLRNYASADERITVICNRQNHGISNASNSALRRVRGQWVVFFDHDDLLVDVALEAMMREALRTGAKIIYSDEDKIDDFNVLSEPNLKPDWNYRLLLSVNYICHLVMIDRALLRRIGQLRSACDGAQDHDLLLRLVEKCPPEQIVHYPEVLYHWRRTASSTAASSAAKPYAVEAGQRAVAEHLRRRGFTEARVEPHSGSTTYRVRWGFTAQPSVTIIIPFKDQIATTRRCLDSVLAHTEWDNWRIVLVDNGSLAPEAAEFCREAVRDPHVVVRRVDEPFNYSRLNNLAAREHPADYYVFLNNDVFLAQDDWLRVLVDEALADPSVGIVGAKLLYPNGTVQHAGVVLGVGGIADHAFRGIPGDHGGYVSRARCAQQYSAVTAACMLCRTDLFMDVGGFDEQHLEVAYNDVDLCLKAGRQGWRVVWTPELVAVHHESLSRGDDLVPSKASRFFYENHIMLERWRDVLTRDPHYNTQFSREGGLFMNLR